jgi:ABC-type amino acid transport substrate-binding protein
MPKNTVKLENQVEFESLLAAVSTLNKTDKHKLLEILEDQLFDDALENDPELMADIEAARADYAAGDYVTFEEYLTQRRAAAV